MVLAWLPITLAVAAVSVTGIHGVQEAVVDDAVTETPLVSPHQQALEAYRDVPTHPDLLGQPGEPIIPLQTPRDVARPCTTIFGYLPYWESSANIHWNLLTHVACFSVEVKGDGSLSSLHGWPWTGVINSAHANGVKVVLVATCFNDPNISMLINSATYKANFFANIKSKMLLGADGLNIDFEGTGSWRSQIHTFMAELTAYLHAEIPGSEVTFAGPSVNYSSTWDLLSLAQSCDGIFIMGYAFWGSWSTSTGPNAPLTGGTYNITNTVVTQYYPVTQVMPEKLILGVPYYGNHWTTSASTARATVIDFIGSTRFTNDQPNSQTYGRLWDTTSQTPWYTYQVSSVWHQVWYDDAESLGLKYQLAEDHGLQGVGMWALNYDGTRSELWNELQTRYVSGCCAHETVASEVTLFEDDFDAGTSAANWSVYPSSSDYTAEFAYDYSVRSIPAAPHSSGTTIGVKFTVNKNDAVAATAALSAYPLGQVFSGDYALRFDMWINYNGGAGGGTGSTEFMMAGLNTAGTRVIWPSNAASDGYTFAVDGEGGAADDYRAYQGPTEYAIGSGVYVPKTLNNTDTMYLAMFPSTLYETAGVPGKQWVEVDIRQTGSALEWRINGVKLASIANPTVTAGNVMLGYMDPYASIASPAADNFIIYDNVRVVQLAESDCNGNSVADACETIADGDYDADGVVQWADFVAMADCWSGPGEAPAPIQVTCAPVCLAAFDLAGDGDIDLADFAAFQPLFEQ